MLTAAEATSLLHDGEYVHNFAQAGFALLGVDYPRAEAIKAFEDAESIELGGEGCQRMKHPIVVFEKGGRHTFFEADMDKVYAKFPDERAA